MSNNYDALIGEAKKILLDLGYSRKGSVSPAAAFTLVALAGLKPGQSWDSASNDCLTIRKGLMERMAQIGKGYKENSRETIRKEGVNALIALGLVIKNPKNPRLPPNSPHTHYSLTQDALSTLRRYNTPQWARKVSKLVQASQSRITSEKRKHARQGTPLQGGFNIQVQPVV